MTQTVLQFDPMQAQAANMQRVRSEIERQIIAFFAVRHIGSQFHVSDLFQFVSAAYKCAPDSPRRIMSEMMTDGLLGYAVVSRRQSLYEITAMPEAARKEAA